MGITAHKLRRSLANAGGPRAFEVIYGSQQDVTSPSSPTTFTSLDFGDENSERSIVIAIASRDARVTGVTIGGITATQMYEGIEDTGYVIPEFWVASVPTGTSGNVVVSYTDTPDWMSISSYICYSLDTTPYDTASDSNATPSVTIDVPSNGAILAVGTCANPYDSSTWTGVTTDYALDVAGDGASSGSISELSAQTGRTVSNNNVGTIQSIAVMSLQSI